MPQLIRRLLGQSAEEIRLDLLAGDDSWLTNRRRIVRISLLGMASMAAVSLLQTGAVRHLPDPPLRGFASDKVNRSDTSYQFGVPDGTLSLASFAINVPLAALGGRLRTERRPWIPLVISAKATAEALMAGYYFLQMPLKEKAWCGYCIVGAAASLTVFGLSLTEARQALRDAG
jgi:uncharacterized membrane protein